MPSGPARRNRFPYAGTPRPLAAVRLVASGGRAAGVGSRARVQAAADHTAATAVFGRSLKLLMARFRFRLPSGRDTEIARLANAPMTRGKDPSRTRQASSSSAASRT